MSHIWLHLIRNYKEQNDRFKECMTLCKVQRLQFQLQMTKRQGFLPQCHQIWHRFTHYLAARWFIFRAFHVRHFLIRFTVAKNRRFNLNLHQQLPLTYLVIFGIRVSRVCIWTFTCTLSCTCIYFWLGLRYLIYTATEFISFTLEALPSSTWNFLWSPPPPHVNNCFLHTNDLNSFVRMVMP